MKTTNKKVLPVMLAGLLQLLPFLRSALPAWEFAASPTGSLVLRWVAGGVAFFGYHAVSSASSISISPPVATIGTPYAGTLTYSGSHSGSVSSMKYNGVCLGSTALAPGLTVTYTSGHTASISGTPTGTSNNLSVTMVIYDGICSGLNDTRTTGLTIQAAGAGLSAPIVTTTPLSLVSQVGADALFSGGATGNPTPQYYWKQGITVLPGATNNSLLLPTVQLFNSGVYTMTASNSQGQTPAACYLSVALTPGSNILAYHFTNYIVSGTPLIMSSFLTNAPAGITTYAWQFNHVNIGVTTSNLSLTGAQTIPSKSGIYSINFNSSVASTIVVTNQAYDSYWEFGYLPFVTNQPTGGTVPVGTNFTFTVSVGGTAPTVLLYQNGSNLVAQQTLSTFTNGTATSATNVSFTLSNLTTADSGTYTVQVTNYWGTTISSNAVLTVGSGSPPPSPVLAGAVSGGQFTVAFPSALSQSYTVQYKTNLSDPTWSLLTNFTADTTNATASDSTSNSPSRFYRVTAP